jgi:ArsR family transcriptional regulator
MEQSNYVKIFKALSNEQRLKIFLMIYEECRKAEAGRGKAEFKVGSEEACCPCLGTLEKAFSMVCGCMTLSRSTISHHFKELQNAGLITCEREGQTFRCRINQEAIDAIKGFVP